MSDTAVDTQKPLAPMAAFNHTIAKMEPQFAAALPAHIPVGRFVRVLRTAVQTNPKLLNVEARSLWNAAMKCAQDGLLPDGKEAALVDYFDRERGAIAQYLPMIGGIRKKVRNSKEIATWDVVAVYEKDQFDFQLGDDPFISHKPTLGEKGKLIAVYSIATLKSGEKSRDVMSVEDVEKIRSVSRAKNGPWANPIFYPEMAKKTVARRHSKVLPMSTDLDDLLRRDDELYDMKAAGDAEVKRPARQALAASLDALAIAGPDPVRDEPTGEVTDVDPDTGEVLEREAEGPATGQKPAQDARQQKAASGTGKKPAPAVPPKAAAEPAKADGEGGVASDFAKETEAAADAGGEKTPAQIAWDKGYAAARKGIAKAARPNFPSSDEKLSWLDGWEAADAERGGDGK